MDLTEFTAAQTELATAVGVVGAAVVAIYVSTKTFGFVTAWVGKMFGAGRGKSGG
jgi:hypothetical protein